MNNSIIKIFLIILIVIFPLITFAGGSSFSRYGFGDILRCGDSRTYAMSGTGIAFIDAGFINGLNPAGLARISNTRFSAGLEYNDFFLKMKLVLHFIPQVDFKDYLLLSRFQQKTGL